MRSLLFGFLAVAAVAAAAAFGQRPAQADFFDPPTSCQELVTAVDSARRSHDMNRLESLYHAAEDPKLACPDRTIFCEGRIIALGFLDEGYRIMEKGGAADEMEALLSRGRSFGAPWQLLATIGQLRLARAQDAHSAALYEIATKDLQEALNSSADKPPCPGEPAAPSGAVDDLRQKSAASQMLAAHFVAVPTSRGECGGIFLAGERGFGTVPTPVPIRFDFDRADMTEEGVSAATVMRECIKSSHFHHIVLSGHTDSRGDPGYNKDLSARRLATVRDFLLKGGVQAAIVLLPKGASEPFQIDDVGKYTPAEIDQFNRRVEIREGSK